MSDLARGTTLSATQLLTNTVLHQLIDNTAIDKGFITGKTVNSALNAGDKLVIWDSVTDSLRAVLFSSLLANGVQASTLAVNQPGHSFVAGDLLYRQNATTYAKAKADAESTAAVCGIVSSVAGANDFVLTTAGVVTGLSGLTAGKYFLSAATAGASVTLKPYSGNLVIPVFIALTASTLILLPYSAPEPFVGEFKDWSMATAPAGWVLCSGGSIGSATSGGTLRANADCEALFKHLWDNYANTEAAVSTGRGASAVADWSANKNIAVPDFRGRVAAGKDDMGGVAASRLTATYFGVAGTTIGKTGGEEGHTLAIGEIPSHSHTFTAAGTYQGGAVAGIPSAAGAGFTTATAGGGGAHNNVQHTMIVTKVIKL